MKALKPAKIIRWAVWYGWSQDVRFSIPSQETVVIALVVSAGKTQFIPATGLLALLMVTYMLCVTQALYEVYGPVWDHDFRIITTDILTHPLFLMQKNFLHHTTSTYDHVVRVARVAHMLARLLSLDAVSTARGALLHDFFLYDWRERTRRGFDHMNYHAQIALDNARTVFSLTCKEEDIIATHMYPRSGRFYRYRESALVSMVDKGAALWEYLITREQGRVGSVNEQYYSPSGHPVL
ncbi:MAG: HD domain-containing protein [Sphaerochaetaceae bacterium]|nr:HD domain-containing protein [Sphaerochaetaceae bacterium]